MKLEFDRGKVPDAIFDHVRELAAKYGLEAQVVGSTKDKERQVDSIVLMSDGSYMGRGILAIDGEDAGTAYYAMERTEPELVRWQAGDRGLNELVEIATRQMVTAMLELTTPQQERLFASNYSRAAERVARGIARRVYDQFISHFPDEQEELCEILRSRIPDAEYREVRQIYDRIDIAERDITDLPLGEMLLFANADVLYNSGNRVVERTMQEEFKEGVSHMLRDIMGGELGEKVDREM